MFENAELGHTLDREAYNRELPRLRADLLAAQNELAASNLSTLLVVAGMPTAGRSEAVDSLLEWLDARGVQTHAMRKPTDEEAQRPAMFRYWRALPASGRIGIFFGGWDAGVVNRRALGKLSEAELGRALDQYIAFERMLVQENVVLIKLWLHLSRKAMKRRLRKLEADPDNCWRVSRQDRKLLRRYDELRSAGEAVIRRTDTAEAPWTILDASNRRYRDFHVGRVVLAGLRAGLERARSAPPRLAPQSVMLTPTVPNVIGALDLSKKANEATYEKELKQLQGELGRLTRNLEKVGRSLILVFEGPDAAGKGGAIRRLTRAMDARDYQVISVSAPTDEERAHPYLWRFWRHLPPHGRVVIYDRSWYGRVLVERVEGFATEEEWQRAYAEINDFEGQLIDSGVVLVKFWLAIGPEEQLRRFTDRKLTPYKQHKLTEEDWRNRAKWDSYLAAACDMVERTSTETTPWTLIPADNKEHARLEVLKAVVGRLRESSSK